MKYFVFLLIIFSKQVIADIYVIMHKDANVVKLDLKTIKALYLGDRKFINEVRILPLDQHQWEVTRNIFYQAIVDKPQNHLISHWARLFFTGKGQAPIKLASDKSILHFVRNNPNTIGYIDKRFVTDDVKPVFIIKD